MNGRGIRRTFPLCARIFEFLVQTPIFKKFVGPRFLAVYWLKKSFLSKVKGMNDRGIRLTFPLYALVLPKYEI